MQAKVGPMMLPDDAIDWAKTGSIVAHGIFYFTQRTYYVPTA